MNVTIFGVDASDPVEFRKYLARGWGTHYPRLVRYERHIAAGDLVGLDLSWILEIERQCRLARAHIEGEPAHWLPGVDQTVARLKLQQFRSILDRIEYLWQRGRLEQLEPLAAAEAKRVNGIRHGRIAREAAQDQVRVTTAFDAAIKAGRDQKDALTETVNRTNLSIVTVRKHLRSAIPPRIPPKISRKRI